MKKLSTKSKLHNLRKSRYVFIRNKKDKRKQKAFNELCKMLERIHAPRIFAIDTNDRREKLSSFLHKIRINLVLRGKGICIDFSASKQFVADGMLLFVAELNRAMQLSGNRLIVRCVPPKKNKLRQVLQQIGLFRIFKYRYTGVRSHDEDVVHWRFAKGIKVEGSTYEHLLGPYNGRITEALQSKLYVGLVEGMKNVRHHAHLQTRKDSLNVSNDIQNWWMFSQERDGFLSVLLCDLGVGIPDTLPVVHHDAYSALVRRLQLKSAQLNDSEIINEATQLMATRTGKDYRGRGLGQMVNAITKEFSGKVHIYSNRGCYTNDSGTIQLREYANSILGTLVYWKVPLRIEN